jgi:MYXO-CTERM domain-containing protein
MMASVLISMFAMTPVAHAEGSDQLPGQWLLVENVLYVDVLDPDNERLAFQGEGGVVVRAPDGTDLGVLMAGGEMVLTGWPSGSYELRPQAEQRGYWDISVAGPSDADGRLFSYDWMLDARGYDDPYGFDGMFFGRVDGGEDGRDAVVALDLQGWTGHRWTAMATAHGVNGYDAGRSVDRYVADVDPEIPLYLNPPVVSGAEPLVPEASGLRFTMNERSDEFGGMFSFSVNARGTWRIVCDSSPNGSVDPTENTNVVLSGRSEGPGEIELVWDGRTWDGGYMSGSGECGLTLSVGELHFLADDIETAFPGLRTYVLDGGYDATPMFWNDSLVARDDVAMANGEMASIAAGPDGVLGGSLEGEATPNVDARSWGNFNDQGKGDRSMLDTWTFVDRSTPDMVKVDDFGGPGDRDDSTNDRGSGFQPPEPSIMMQGLATGGYFKGGCSTASGSAGSAGLLAMLAGLVSFGLRRRED